MKDLAWRVGMEIELLAPVGKSRLDLALAVADSCGGKLEPFFHSQSEPSLVEGTPVFHNLTLGFRVEDAQGRWVVSCVDDLTLQADLRREAAPKPGWYRVISDDPRLLRLIQQQADANQPCAQVLQPIGCLFGTRPQAGPDGMVRVNDRAGASIAIAAPLPGERERPCELITPPLEKHHQARLESLLKLARGLGFSQPREGATHLHFDAASLQSAPALANLICLLWIGQDWLKRALGTNPHCRRLGPWPEELWLRVSQPDFAGLKWGQACAQLRPLNLTKYCDFNLMNCIHEAAPQNTLEIRILPVWLESRPTLEAAALFVAILQRCLQTPAVKPDARWEELWLDLSLTPRQRAFWPSP